MTNQQLYPAVGLPCLLILLNTTVMFYLFTRLEARIDKLDAKLDIKTEALDSKLDVKTEGLGGRIDNQVSALRIELSANVDKLASDYTNFKASKAGMMSA